MWFCGTEIVGMKFGINHARTTFNLELMDSGHHLINIQFPIPNSSWTKPLKWLGVFLHDVSFPTFKRSKSHKKIETRVWQYQKRTHLRNRNLPNSDCSKSREKVGWVRGNLRTHGADSGVLAALCVSYLLETCKHILSCTEYFVCEQEAYNAT